MKKFAFRGLLAALLLFCSAPAWAYTFSAVNDDGTTIYYNITSEDGAEVKTVEVTYNGSTANTQNDSYSGDVTIPETVTHEGTTYTVGAIGDYAFFYCSGLTSIVIPESVTTIGEGAFQACSGLTSIVIPESVTTIGESAFALCSSLATVYFNAKECTSVGTSSNSALFYELSSIKDVYIGEDVTTLREVFFYDCTGIETVHFNAKSCETVGDEIFNSCSSIKDVEFGDNVTIIPDSLFCGYYSSYFPYFTSVTIPENVKTIGNYAFGQCEYLTSVTIDSNVLETIGEGAFYYCSGLTSIVIPESVTTIGEYAFYLCSGLTSIVIPESVTTIGESAFLGCSSLATVYFNAKECTGTTSTFAFFYSLSSIKDVYIGEKVTTLPAYLFYNCTGIKSVHFNAKSCETARRAFCYCSSIKDVEFGDSVTIIPDYLFYGAESSNFPYFTSVTIPENVKTIGSAFIHCEYLTSVTINSNVLETIGTSAFVFCSALTSIVIPESVTTIGEYAFEDTGLTDVEIPASVTSIGLNPFLDCSSLTQIQVDDNNPNYCSIDGVLFTKDETELIVYPIGKSPTTYEIPASVTNIGRLAFFDCASLESVILGSSVETIERQAFMSCSNLSEIISFNTVPPTFTYDTPPTFWGTNGKLSVTLYVPAGSKETYTADTGNAGHSYSTWNPTATNSSIAKIKEFLEVDITAQEAATDSEVAETSEDDGEGNSEAVKYGYSTFYTESPFYTSYSYPLTNDLKCATASVSDGTLTMNWAYGNNSEADVVPGGTAVVLYGPLGTNYPVIYEEGDDASVSDAPKDNMLLGSEEEIETYGPDDTKEYIYYMLSYSGKNDNGECEDMGFYYGAPDGAAFTSKANKAWLPVPDDGSGAKITSFVFGYDAGETTAIRTVDSGKPESDAIYNLQGIRVNDMNRKGIYIVGGKKVIKK